jgi:hypothetical protein
MMQPKIFVNSIEQGPNWADLKPSTRALLIALEALVECEKARDHMLDADSYYQWLDDTVSSVVTAYEVAKEGAW